MSRWVKELHRLVKDIPQVTAVHVRPGVQVDEVWVVVNDELTGSAWRQISDVVADIQLKFDFVLEAVQIVRSEEEVPAKPGNKRRALIILLVVVIIVELAFFLKYM